MSKPTLEEILDKHVLQVAMVHQRADAMEWGGRDKDNPDIIHPSWDEIGETGQQEYIKDAKLSVQALVAIGWSPVVLSSIQVIEELMNSMQQDWNVPPGIRKDMTMWLNTHRYQVEAAWKHELTKDHNEVQ